MKNKNLTFLPKILDERGNLTFIEGLRHVPFDIKRAYWIYDVPGGEKRGGHSFKTQNEFIIALSGSFDVKLEFNDGSKKKISLNRSYFGVFVPKGTWREMCNFSTNSLALVLASTFFDENDYIRDYSIFKQQELVDSKANFENEKLISVLNKFDATKSSIQDCYKLKFDKNHRIKGNITVVENNQNIPFEIKRIYYLYDIPSGEERGGHAHKNLFQILIAASGSFDVHLNDGKNKKKINLNKPDEVLLIKPGIWRELKNFSSGSICLVLASENYSEEDYIRDFSSFKTFKIEK